MNLNVLLLVIVYFALTGLFAGSETGSYMINRIRLRFRVLNRKHSARVLAQVLRDPHLFVFTVLIGQNICVYLLSKLVTDQYVQAGISVGGTRFVLGFIPWNAEMAATLTLMFPLFIFAEVVPKNLFRKKADTLMYHLADLLRFFMLLFYPATVALRQLFRLLTRGRMAGAERDLHSLSPEGLKEYFSDGAKEGVLSSDQNRMLENVVSMHRVPVRQLMKPIKQLPKLPEEATMADFRRLVGRQGAAYVALTSHHLITGVVSMFTLAQRTLEDSEKLKPYAGTVLQIEERQNLKSAFYRLRRNPLHLAVVVNVHHHPVGFIHLEDIARFIAAE
ncbi:MAG: CNNM domain-containing protein [Kiritimatiellales bacterium]|nr:CNNM domain-containing protein [Kiritimatiellales bacterium]